MWRVILLSLCLLLLSSFLPYSSSWGESVQEKAQAELLNLKIQLINTGKAINVLKSDIAELKTIITNYEKITNDLQTQLDALKAELETQETLYAKLSKQSNGLKQYITRLETERTWLIVGCVGAGVVATGAVIWAIAK